MKTYNWKTLGGTITIPKKSLHNPEEFIKTMERKYADYYAGILKTMREYVYGSE